MGKRKLLVFDYFSSSRFLWRKNATFAISRHYRRFDVFVEAEANKAGGKYDNGSIDFQVEFYRREGLTPYSEAKLPITSGTAVNLPSYSLCPKLRAQYSFLGYPKDPIILFRT